MRVPFSRAPTFMPYRLIAFVVLALSGLFTSQAADWGTPPAIPPPPPPVMVLMDTSLGAVVLRLNPQRAPQTVANFLGYVRSGYYDGMIFHRVIAGFMAQGGGFDERFKRRTMREPVVNEADNGLRNVRGSIAMARDGRPHSATSEFFINLVDNPKLDYPNPDGWGYTVFGQVESGMDAVDRMAAIPTGAGGEFESDVPQIAVIIKSMKLQETPVPALSGAVVPAAPTLPNP